MSYTPTSWSTGDTITAAAMNKIENGIANAGGASPVVVTMSGSAASITSDLTFNEIATAFNSGAPVIVDFSNATDWGDIQSLVSFVDNTNYRIAVGWTGELFIMSAASANGYITWSD